MIQSWINQLLWSSNFFDFLDKMKTMELLRKKNKKQTRAGGREKKKKICTETRARSREEASVRWPSLTETITSYCQGRGLKHQAPITHALCCEFNSQVKSINGYPPDWLELINMATQDANVRWGRSETRCQTPARQGQNCCKFMLCEAAWQNSSHCALPGHSTVLPGHLNPRWARRGNHCSGCIILS